MTSATERSIDTDLPIAIIGAGPIGLAAAAHLIERGIDFLVLESGDQPGASVLQWAHVRMFSPWKYNLDQTSVALLTAVGWQPPDPESFPTGRDLYERYLAPLAAVPEITSRIRLQTEVAGLSRLGSDRQSSRGRERAPFVLRLRSADGREDELTARAVIDASGTWTGPKPLGAHGLPAIGEAATADRIAYRVPDLLGRDRGRYAGRSVAVVGGGDSAFNAIAGLDALAVDAPATRVHWILRGERPGYGGGAADQLPARGALGLAVRRLVERDRISIHAGFAIARVETDPAGVHLSSRDRTIGPFDEIICVTGYRPDHRMLEELRLDLDPITQAPAALGPLIDPNVHSCGTVPPHGYRELAHPEDGFFMVGMKSYGRAPTFLLLTGYEQVRSVVAALAGDSSAAREVALVLPETGVCSTGLAPEVARDSVAEVCCGSVESDPAPAEPVSITEAAPHICCGRIDNGPTSAKPVPIAEPVPHICCGRIEIDPASASVVPTTRSTDVRES